MENALDKVPGWTDMLFDMLEYNEGVPGVLGAFQLGGAAEGASRWDAVDPVLAPTSADTEEALPGLFVRRDVKKITPSENVRREISSLVNRKIGLSGISLYSLDTDLDIIMDGFCAGVEAVGSSMSISDTETVIGGAPLTTVEHDNQQLYWGRVSARHPDKKVHMCINGSEEGGVYMPCFAHTLPGNQGALQMWLSVSQQNLFDETGELPPRGPCLLCIRKGLQKLVMIHGTETNMMRMSGKRLVVPPFAILVDQPGGYSSQYCITPANSQVVTTPFPVNAGTLLVRTNETGTQWYVDQGELVYNVTAESLN